MTFDFFRQARQLSRSASVCVNGVQARAFTTNTKTTFAHIFVCILSPVPFTLSFAFYPLKTTPPLEPPFFMVSTTKNSHLDSHFHMTY